MDTYFTTSFPSIFDVRLNTVIFFFNIKGTYDEYLQHLLSWKNKENAGTFGLKKKKKMSYLDLWPITLCGCAVHTGFCVLHIFVGRLLFDSFGKGMCTSTC